MSLGHGVGASLVPGQGVALEHRLEVVAGLLLSELVAVGCRPGGAVGLEHGQHLTLLDRLPDCHLDPPDHAGRFGQDLVLHLHGFEDDQRLAGANRLIGGVGDGDDGGGEGSLDFHSLR